MDWPEVQEQAAREEEEIRTTLLYQPGATETLTTQLNNYISTSFFFLLLEKFPAYFSQQLEKTINSCRVPTEPLLAAALFALKHRVQSLQIIPGAASVARDRKNKCTYLNIKPQHTPPNPAVWLPPATSRG